MPSAKRAPPFSPAAVVDEFVEVLKNYHVARSLATTTAASLSRSRSASTPSSYEVSKQVKSDLFRDLLPLFNSRRIRLPRHHRLVAQIISLERRVSRGGKDSIGQPSHGHDDVANAVAGAGGRGAVAGFSWRRRLGRPVTCRVNISAARLG